MGVKHLPDLEPTFFKNGIVRITDRQDLDEHKDVSVDDWSDVNFIPVVEKRKRSSCGC